MTENVFLLCYEDDSSALINGFCSYFGVESATADNTLRLKNGSVEMNIGVVTQGTNEQFIREQKEAVWQHFHAVPSTDSTLKLNILHQIALSRSFIAVRYSYETDEDKTIIDQSLRDLFKPLRALVLADDGSALLSTDFEIVFDDHGKSQVGSFVPFARPEAEAFHAGADPQKVARQNRSLARLRQRNIFALDELPLLPSSRECALKSVEDMAGRAVCLLTVALFAECLSKGSLKEAQNLVENVKQSFQCERFFSRKEREFLQNPAPGQEGFTHFSWQYENLLVMEWVMGFVDTLEFPGEGCNVPDVFGVMNRFDSLAELVKQARVRSVEEILDEADFTYRLDWACVDARINGLEGPTGVVPGVVMERHKTFKWLISAADWDDVDIST
ncbi:MAG: DUF4272 domain-containing protein [Peptococcaceae bacterium]|nr:DUF4272 domain-containing protein [Peptococcaceae bacterium]